MTQIRLNLPSELNQALKIFKQIHGYPSMEDATIELLFNILRTHKVAKELLKQNQVDVGTITNPILSIVHDYFGFKGFMDSLVGPSYTYRTQIEFGMISKQERDFLNKATREEVERRYTK